MNNPNIADIAFLFFTQALELLVLKSKLTKDNWQVVEPQFCLPNERVSLWESLLYYQQLHTSSRKGHLIKNFTSEEPPANLLEVKQVADSIENIRQLASPLETLTLMGSVFSYLEDQHCKSLAIKLLKKAAKAIEEQQSKSRLTPELMLNLLRCNNSLISIAQKAYQAKNYRTVVDCLSDIKSYSGLMLLATAIKEQPDEPSALVDARIKFLSAAEAEDATEEEKIRAQNAAKECRSQMSEENIERARESKRQSRKQQPRLERRLSTRITETSQKTDTYPSGTSIILPAETSPLTPRQKLLKQNAALSKEFDTVTPLYT